MARNLSESIVEFVKAWDDVVKAKLIEFATKDPDKKKVLEAKNQETVQSSPNTPFSYIYKWLEVGEDNDGNGYIKPHKAKKRPGEIREPTKMRCNVYPCGADIADYFCDNPTGDFKDNSSIKSSVYRLLPELEELKKIKKCNKGYLPTDIEHTRDTMAQDLADLTSLKKDCFFSVSKNTFIIHFETAKPGFKNEKAFFKKYLDKDLYDMIAYENRLVIFLKGNTEKCTIVGTTLRKTVKDAYALQQKAAKKK